MAESRTQSASDARALADRLRDGRGRRVVFLSHCLLNENTRYLGGACRPGCVPEVVAWCLAHDVGIVQLPCPEQAAWGGVLKRRLLGLYGVGRRAPVGRLEAVLVPLALAWTRRVFRRLARRAADAMEDYLRSGYAVVAVVGVDGSPSCGVRTTLDGGAAMRELLGVDAAALTVEAHNALVRRHATAGAGLFVAELRAELRRRGLDVPFVAHDLFAELAGRPSTAVAELSALERAAGEAQP